MIPVELCSVLKDRVSNLSAQLRLKVESCPTEGQGVHPWLFKTARSLHKHFSEEEIVDILSANLSCQRPEREVRDAVVNAGKYARGEMGSPSQKPWPTVDYTLVHEIVVNSRIRLKDLSSISPVDLTTEEPRTGEVLNVLFPGNPMLCLAREVNACWTRPREFWRARESEFQFIVPNPMTREQGTKSDGGKSQRCLDNTGPRENVVIEFDISGTGDWAPYIADWKNKGITVHDANVALLIELALQGRPRLPLGLAVDSGGKSVHAWYPCAGLTDEQLKPFMTRAVRLGADKTTWTRCQLVRMPDGMRNNGNRQRVHYFAPSVIAEDGGVK
jgi:hypothetical protein